ncbi:hypothetical protein [Chryseobacterium sp. Leaf180]|uniref:hypothetical protein n=1 Tax=Chryseobacterium sp. Leaf180 TaxID=1736289 RepID=UPI001040198A|nr:hypothetical protein [Chryseobacterium sp. Leaf180]
MKPSPDHNFIIVSFEGIKNKKHSEIKCDFNPYVKKIRKLDGWELSITWDSKIYTDKKTGEKPYFTYLLCHRAVEINSP